MHCRQSATHLLLLADHLEEDQPAGDPQEGGPQGQAAEGLAGEAAVKGTEEREEAGQHLSSLYEIQRKWESLCSRDYLPCPGLAAIWSPELSPYIVYWCRAFSNDADVTTCTADSLVPRQATTWEVLFR